MSQVCRITTGTSLRLPHSVPLSPGNPQAPEPMKQGRFSSYGPHGSFLKTKWKPPHILLVILDKRIRSPSRYCLHRCALIFLCIRKPAFSCTSLDQILYQDVRHADRWNAKRYNRWRCVREAPKILTKTSTPWTPTHADRAQNDGNRVPS